MRKGKDVLPFLASLLCAGGEEYVNEAAVNKKLASCRRQECGRLCGCSGNAALHLGRRRSQPFVSLLVHDGSNMIDVILTKNLF